MDYNNLCTHLTPQMVYRDLLAAEKNGRYPEATALAKKLANMIEMGEDDEGICDWTISADWLEIRDLVAALERLNYVLNFRARIVRNLPGPQTTEDRS